MFTKLLNQTGIISRLLAWLLWLAALAPAGEQLMAQETTGGLTNAAVHGERMDNAAANAFSHMILHYGRGDGQRLADFVHGTLHIPAENSQAILAAIRDYHAYQEALSSQIADQVCGDESLRVRSGQSPQTLSHRFNQLDQEIAGRAVRFFHTRLGQALAPADYHGLAGWISENIQQPAARQSIDYAAIYSSRELDVLIDAMCAQRLRQNTGLSPEFTSRSAR